MVEAAAAAAAFLLRRHQVRVAEANENVPRRRAISPAAERQSTGDTP